MHHFSHNSNACFHLLLHLEKPDELFLDQIRQTGYDETRIRQQLSIPGSRFFPEFVSDIQSLITRLNECQSSVTLEANGNLRITAQVDLKYFPQGAGTNAVIPVDKLTDSQKSNLFLQRNRGYHIQHLHVTSLPSTRHFMVFVKPLKKGHHFITAFPGEASMPMPHHGMKPTLFEACKVFWDNHVVFVQE
jgi:hypothetical protein